MTLSVNARNVAASIVPKLMKLGLSQAEAYGLRDAVIRTDKSLTNLGGIIAGTPLPNAVDVNGNLLLKNVVQGTALTAGPTTNSGTFSVIPEMTQTITTKGNKVLLIFNGTFQVDTLAALLSIAIFRDGAQLSYLNLTSWPDANAFEPSSISWLDQNPAPPAGSHTYDLRWKVSTGVATAVGTDRALQIAEQG